MRPGCPFIEEENTNTFAFENLYLGGEMIFGFSDSSEILGEIVALKDFLLAFLWCIGPSFEHQFGKVSRQGGPQLEAIPEF